MIYRLDPWSSVTLPGSEWLVTRETANDTSVRNRYVQKTPQARIGLTIPLALGAGVDWPAVQSRTGQGANHEEARKRYRRVAYPCIDSRRSFCILSNGAG